MQQAHTALTCTKQSGFSERCFDIIVSILRVQLERADKGKVRNSA